MFEDLLVRVKLDEEAAARVRKEQDELLEKDTDASQWAIELLAELEMEQDLKLKAKDRSTALQQRANQDAEVIARLRREQDELRRTEERLRLERSMAHEEHDWAVQERDEALQEARAL